MTSAIFSDYLTPSLCLHTLVNSRSLRLFVCFSFTSYSSLVHIEALLAELRSRSKIQHLSLFHTINTKKYKYPHLRLVSCLAALFYSLHALTHSLDLPRQSARVPHSGRRCRNYSAPKVHRPTGMRRFCRAVADSRLCFYALII